MPYLDTDRGFVPDKVARWIKKGPDGSSNTVRRHPGVEYIHVLIVNYKSTRSELAVWHMGTSFRINGLPNNGTHKLKCLDNSFDSGCIGRFNGLDELH